MTNGANELSIHEFGDLVAVPTPLLGAQNEVSWLKVISISSFCVGCHMQSRILWLS